MVTNGVIPKMGQIALDEKSKNIFINNEIIGIKALYDNALSAYPGDVSNEIVCDERFRPIFFEEKNYVILYSNERFGMGACTKDIIKYKYLIGWLYCNNLEELYSIEYFAPIDKENNALRDIFLSFSCKESI